MGWEAPPAPARYGGEPAASARACAVRSFPPPTRWRRPSSAGAVCGRRKPGRCSGPRRDAVPRERRWPPVRKVKHRAAFPSPPAPPTYTPVCSSAVAALPTSLPPCAVGSGAPAAAGAVSGRRGSARAASVLLSAGRASGRWVKLQASVSPLGAKLSRLCPAVAQTLVVFSRSPPLLCLHVPPPLRAPLQASGWPLTLRALHSHAGAGGRSAGRPPQPFLPPAEASALASGPSFALGGWVVCLF